MSSAPAGYFVGSLVVVNAFVTDADFPTCGADFTVDWKFLQVPAGSAVTTVIPPFAVQATFTPDVVGNYVLMVTVTDSAGLVGHSLVSVTITN
jgi:hypothetical protein